MKRNASCFASFSLVFAKPKKKFFASFRIVSHQFFSLFRFKLFASKQKPPFFVILHQIFASKYVFSLFRIDFFASKHLYRYFASFFSVLRSWSRKEPHHLVGAGAVTRCGSSSDGSDSDNGSKHG
jgi:hypothetical protein